MPEKFSGGFSNLARITALLCKNVRKRDKLGVRHGYFGCRSAPAKIVLMRKMIPAEEEYAER